MGVCSFLGLLEWPTKDLDVVALVTDDTYQSADPHPEDLQSAAVEVANALGLAHDWLNPGPTSLLDLGLPKGFRERATIRRFGNLIVHLASRYDQICFKLYAATDQGQGANTRRTFELSGQPVTS